MNQRQTPLLSRRNYKERPLGSPLLSCNDDKPTLMRTDGPQAHKLDDPGKSQALIASQTRIQNMSKSPLEEPNVTPVSQMTFQRKQVFTVTKETKNFSRELKAEKPENYLIIELSDILHNNYYWYSVR